MRFFRKRREVDKDSRYCREHDPPQGRVYHYKKVTFLLRLDTDSTPLDRLEGFCVKVEDQ